MMKKNYLVFILVVTALVGNAQQSVNYTHEFYKPMLSNPAYTGATASTNAMLISRSQWIDFKSAPRLNIFTLDGITPNQKMGLGIDLFTDKKGISTKIGGSIKYAYWLKLNDNSRLSFGISVGVTDHTLNYSQGVFENPADPYVLGASQRITNVNGNAGIGFFWKKLEVGVSAPQLLGNALNVQDNESGKATYAPSTYYNGTLKYKFIVSENKELSITPMGMIHFFPAAPLQYDANLNVQLKALWIGATYKSDHAVSANAGVIISKKIAVGYAYDFMIGDIGAYSGMSHEIMLNFVFGKSENSKAAEEAAEVKKRLEEQSDSLQTELQIKANKAKSDAERIAQLELEAEKLRKENEQLEKTRSQSPNSEAGSQLEVPDAVNNNPATTGSPANSNGTAAKSGSTEKNTVENGVKIVSATTDHYTYLKNKKSAKKGFYVITGTYLNLNFAEDALKKEKSARYSSSKILFSSEKQYHYVSVKFFSDKADAVELVNKIKGQESRSAWILSVQ